MPCGPPITGTSGSTPHRDAAAGSMRTSAQSWPGSPCPEVMCETVPTVAIVEVSTCITTGWPMLSTQWRAVPMYCDVPSVKMKFAVQPYGETMQPAAEMPGDCTPGQSVLSAAAGMWTPLPSRFMTFFWTLAVYQGPVARTGAETPAAMAVPVQARPRTHANTAATPQL